MNNYKNLVISGGGFNGFQFFGIIKYLEEHDMIKNFDKFIGVSMGAFTSLLIILGYKFSEIENFLLKFNFEKIFDLKLEQILNEKFRGLTDGENFTKLIKKFIINKHFNENITMKELFDKTNKMLIVGTTNLTYDKMEYISHENYPDIPVYLLLRMTSCIPIFFNPISYNDSYYVDGVMKDNFPIQLIPDNEIGETIGIVLQTSLDKYEIDDMNIINYLTHLYRVVVNEVIKNKVDKYKNLTKILIVKPKVSSYNYQLTEELRIELIECGYNCCKETFD